MSTPHRRARVVLLLGIVFGLGYLIYRFVVVGSGAGINFDVYRGAATALWDGDQIYGVSPIGHPDYTFRYPSITLVWFSIYLLVNPLAGYLLHVFTILMAGTLLGYLLISVVEQHGISLGAIDRWLVVGFVTVGPLAAPSLFYGNVNHHVALVVGLGLVWLAQGRNTMAGVAVGIGALVKVFPAGLGIWFLHRRAWRALLAAIAIGLSGLGLGALLFGVDRTWTFFEVELFSRASPDVFTGGLPPNSEYVSLLRPLSVLLPSVGQITLMILSLVLLAPVIGYLYHRETDPVAEQCALFATIAAILLVLPSFSLYFLLLAYPLVPLLYLLPGRPGILFAAGAALMQVTLKLPDIATVLDIAPPWFAAPVLAVARLLYTVATPVLLGTLVMLAACILFARSEDIS